MSIKLQLALAAAVILGVASAALAADDNPMGGFRELSNGATITEGVNPADHRSLRDVQASERRGGEEIERREQSPMQPPSNSRSAREDNYGPDAGKE